MPNEFNVPRKGKAERVILKIDDAQVMVTKSEGAALMRDIEDEPNAEIQQKVKDVMNYYTAEAVKEEGGTCTVAQAGTELEAKIAEREAAKAEAAEEEEEEEEEPKAPAEPEEPAE